MYNAIFERNLSPHLAYDLEAWDKAVKKSYT